MSRANVHILDPKGKVIAYSLYNGTTDYQTCQLWLSQEEAWSKYDADDRKSCSHPGEPCTIRSFYGYEEEWTGRVCLDCMILTEGFGQSPWIPKEREGVW